jgi:hypothetical protein
MKRRFIQALICFLVMLSPAVQAASDTDKQRKLAEQKLKLVEMLVNSPAAKKKVESGDADAAALIEQGQALITRAKEHLSASENEQALEALDEALRNLSQANKKSAGGLSVSVQKKRLEEMSEQVGAYRESLVELTQNKKLAAEAQALLTQVDAMVTEANQLAEASRWGEANKKMAASYKLEVEEISRLREGEEVLLSLSFETPADEYAYEQKRFDSNQILVNMMIDEGRAEGGRIRLVNRFVTKADTLKVEAETHAAASRFEEAITSMEQAVKQQNRALSAMGIPVY